MSTSVRHIVPMLSSVSSIKKKEHPSGAIVVPASSSKPSPHKHNHNAAITVSSMKGGTVDTVRSHLTAGNVGIHIPLSFRPFRSLSGLEVAFLQGGLIPTAIAGPTTNGHLQRRYLHTPVAPPKHDHHTTKKHFFDGDGFLYTHSDYAALTAAIQSVVDPAFRARLTRMPACWVTEAQLTAVGGALDELDPALRYLQATLPSGAKVYHSSLFPQAHLLPSAHLCDVAGKPLPRDILCDLLSAVRSTEGGKVSELSPFWVTKYQLSCALAPHVRRSVGVDADTTLDEFITQHAKHQVVLSMPFHRCNAGDPTSNNNTISATMINLVGHTAKKLFPLEFVPMQQFLPLLQGGGGGGVEEGGSKEATAGGMLLTQAQIFDQDAFRLRSPRGLKNQFLLQLLSEKEMDDSLTTSTSAGEVHDNPADFARRVLRSFVWAMLPTKENFRGRLSDAAEFLQLEEPPSSLDALLADRAGSPNHGNSGTKETAHPTAGFSTLTFCSAKYLGDAVNTITVALYSPINSNGLQRFAGFGSLRYATMMNGFHSPLWLSERELEKEGLTLCGDALPTRITLPSGEGKRYALLYNVEQTEQPDWKPAAVTHQPRWVNGDAVGKNLGVIQRKMLRVEADEDLPSPMWVPQADLAQLGERPLDDAYWIPLGNGGNERCYNLAQTSLYPSSALQQSTTDPSNEVPTLPSPHRLSKVKPSFFSRSSALAALQAQQRHSYRSSLWISQKEYEHAHRVCPGLPRSLTDPPSPQIFLLDTTFFNVDCLSIEGEHEHFTSFAYHPRTLNNRWIATSSDEAAKSKVANFTTVPSQNGPTSEAILAMLKFAVSQGCPQLCVWLTEAEVVKLGGAVLKGALGFSVPSHGGESSSPDTTTTYYHPWQTTLTEQQWLSAFRLSAQAFT